MDPVFWRGFDGVFHPRRRHRKSLRLVWSTTKYEVLSWQTRKEFIHNGVRFDVFFWEGKIGIKRDERFGEAISLNSFKEKDVGNKYFDFLNNLRKTMK